MSAIVASNLSKGYRQYDKPLDSLKELLFKRCYHQQFWALQDINFRHESGEMLGVVGDNGAGKSTLLKLLAGTVQPSTGDLKMNGRVSAILELGQGFHPEFSGLENIRMGCAMLGFDAKATNDLIPAIIEFSELEDFIDKPVKTYSSGMYMRLAFSVVTSVDPDILVVDEALAVGDQHFQKKGVDRMMQFRNQGKTLVFCSHNLYHIREMCEQSIWLNQGKIAAIGQSADVVDAYQDFIRGNESVMISKPTTPAETTDKPTTAYLQEVTLLHGQTDATQDNLVYMSREKFAVRVIVKTTAKIALKDIHVGIVIYRNDGIQCYGISTVVDQLTLTTINDDVLGVHYVIDELLLLSGQYKLDVWLIDASSTYVYDSREGCCPFRVRQESTEIGLVHLKHQWLSPT